METVFYFSAVALVTVVITIYLRESGLPTAALLTAICGGVLLLMKLLPFITALFHDISAMASSAELKTDYVDLVLKAVCIAYVGEFAGQLCRDAGEGGMAQKVELGTKLVIMVMAVPLLQRILETVLTVFQ